MSADVRPLFLKIDHDMRQMIFWRGDLTRADFIVRNIAGWTWPAWAGSRESGPRVRRTGFQQMEYEINAHEGAPPAAVLPARAHDRTRPHSSGCASSFGAGIVMEKEAW